MKTMIGYDPSYLYNLLFTLHTHTHTHTHTHMHISLFLVLSFFSFLSLSLSLTGAQNIDHPIPNPVKKRPINMTASNASLFSMKYVAPIADHPIVLGTAVSNREGLRPSPSADQPAINPPSTAPMGDIA